jgi:uncharacterized membrane protein
MAKKESHWHFHPAVRSGDERTLGERAADGMRHGMGSWPFVFGFLGIMAVWMTYNSLSNKPFDIYPFILLNLSLSTLAGLQGAILLIANKRADRISAELAAYHLEISEHADKEIADLKEIIADVRHMMAELDIIKKSAKNASPKKQ